MDPVLTVPTFVMFLLLAGHYIVASIMNIRIRNKKKKRKKEREEKVVIVNSVGNLGETETNDKSAWHV